VSVMTGLAVRLPGGARSIEALLPNLNRVAHFTVLRDDAHYIELYITLYELTLNRFKLTHYPPTPPSSSAP
jgi:hypothetical protein